MKIRNWLVFGLILGLSLTSCKKDKDEDTPDPFEAEYADLTSEENKENLEDAGIEMVGEMEKLADADAIKVAANFAEKSDGIPIEEGSSIDPIVAPVKLIAALDNKDTGVKEVIDELKSAAEEPNSFMDLWDMVAGTYTYNISTGEWDVTAGTDAIVFEFPGLEGDITNTANITINNFSVINLVDPVIELDEGMEAQLPTSLNISLKYNGTEIASYKYTASFETNGMPTGLDTELKISTFSFSVKMNHSPYNEADIKASFKNGETIILEMYVDASGNWSEENIEENTSEEDVLVENIIEMSNAYFQALTIKVAAMVDVKNLVPAIKEEMQEEDDFTEQEAKDMAAALNENIELVVVYANDNKKICEAEAYAYLDEDDGYWDIDIRFIFADGSPVDAETYFSEGFSDLITEMNSFLEDIANEHDIEIEPIEY